MMTNNEGIRNNESTPGLCFQKELKDLHGGDNYKAELPDQQINGNQLTLKEIKEAFNSRPVSVQSSYEGYEEPSVYEVEKIITKKVVEGRVLYKVKWKGYSYEDCTWEPIEHFEDSRLIDNFERDIRRKRKLSKDKSLSSSQSNLYQEESIPSQKIQATYQNETNFNTPILNSSGKYSKEGKESLTTSKIFLIQHIQKEPSKKDKEFTKKEENISQEILNSESLNQPKIEGTQEIATQPKEEAKEKEIEVAKENNEDPINPSNLIKDKTDELMSEKFHQIISEKLKETLNEKKEDPLEIKNEEPSQQMKEVPLLPIKEEPSEVKNEEPSEPKKEIPTEEEQNEIFGDINMDHPERILSIMQNKKVPTDLICFMEWRKRNNGIQPKNSYFKTNVVKKKFPSLLINYYESQFISLLGRKRKQDKEKNNSKEECLFDKK